MGRPLKARLAISTDYAGAYTAVWDGSGHWHEDCKGWQPLHDQIGIRIDQVSIPTPGPSAASEDATAPFADGKVQAVECLATPNTGTGIPAFFLHLTCVIEADEGLVVEPPPSGRSPLARPILREVDARDRYAFRAVHAPSEFVSGTVDTPVRDDTGAAEAEAIALRTTTRPASSRGTC